MAGLKIQVGGLVLCGGQSRRMGRDKARLPIGDECLLTRVVRTMQGVLQPVVVVARKGQSLPPLPHDVLLAYDAIEDGGPVAGMLAGFEALSGKCGAVFVASCDHPLLKPSFILRMIELLDNHAAVVVRHDGHLHSLSAVYKIETYAILQKLIEQGTRSVQDFVERCKAHIITLNEIGEADPALDSLRNVNDRSSYKALIEEFQGS